MNRRDLLKRSALSFAALGLGTLPTNALTASGETATDDGTFAPERRKRPSCLDIPWKAGTGLIWMQGETLFYDNPRNRFMRFRREFEAPADLKTAELRLFADTNYVAWLNGEELGRGPGRSDTTWALYDTYDLSKKLRPGKNTLALLVLFHGFGTGGRKSVMQALLAHLEMTDSAGRKTHVVSDRSWKTSPAPEFLRPSPRLHATLGCMEVQDLRLAEPEWLRPGFDDGDWLPSDYVKPDLAMTPWYHFAPEPLPHRLLEERPLKAETTLQTLAFAPPPVEQLGAVRPVLRPGSVVGLPLSLGAASDAQVLSFQLERTECGYLVLDVEGTAGTVIDALCGEVFADGRLPRPGTARVHTTRFVLREGRQRLGVVFNWIAFRCLQLWITTADRLTVHGVSLRHLSLPLGDTGSFSCSDPFLNRLDAACEHTLRLCAQDGIVDSASREQQQWIGDGRFTAMTLHHRFAVGTLHRRLIEQVGQGVDWLGSLVPRFPTGNVNVSPIPLYSLQWVLAFRDYAFYTGDAGLAEDWRPLIRHVLRWFTAFEREDGLLEKVPHWMYIDLGEGSVKGRIPSVGSVNTTLNLVYLDALRYAAALAQNDKREARAYARRADRLETSLRSALWDEGAGAYRDALLANGKPGTFSEGTNAYALWLLEKPGSDRAGRIVRAVFEKPELKPIMASPFSMNVVFLALGLHRRADLVLPLLPARYAEQVETGSMWEHWHSLSKDADGTPVSHSLSHAWGAGALAFFVGSLAGIRPAEPGWKSVNIEPQPCGLVSAEASVSTARGTLSAAWRKADGRFVLSVRLPKDVGGRCRLPDGSERAVPPGGGEFSCPLA